MATKMKLEVLQGGRFLGALERFKNGASVCVGINPDKADSQAVVLRLTLPESMWVGDEDANLLPPIQGWSGFGEVVRFHPKSFGDGVATYEAKVPFKEVNGNLLPDLEGATNSFVVPAYTASGRGLAIRVGLVAWVGRFYAAMQIATDFPVRSTIGRLALPTMEGRWPALADYFNAQFPERGERKQFGQLCRWSPAPAIDITTIPEGEGIVRFTGLFKAVTMIATAYGDCVHPRPRDRGQFYEVERLPFYPPGARVILGNIKPNPKKGLGVAPWITYASPILIGPDGKLIPQ